MAVVPGEPQAQPTRNAAILSVSNSMMVADLQADVELYSGGPRFDGSVSLQLAWESCCA